MSVAQAFQCSDEGLSYLAGLTKLRRLDLRRLAINGSGLVHLQDMADLQSLDLGATPISDYAAWRWLHARIGKGAECVGCTRLSRSGKLLAGSVVSTTFVLLAIAEIWGR